LAEVKRVTAEHKKAGIIRHLGMTASIFLISAGATVAQAPAPRQGNPAPAATPPAAPPAAQVPAEPSVTTASFGDWTLRCQRLDAAKPGRVCEVALVLQAQGQQAPIAQIAIGRVANNEPLRVTAVMPVSVTFPSSVQIVLGEKDAKPLDLPWRRCIPTGCFADAAPSDEMVRQWRKAGEAGRIQFRDAAGRDLALPLSTRGLDPALDALAKEKL
jgi:invasion protein IalB